MALRTPNQGRYIDNWGEQETPTPTPATAPKAEKPEFSNTLPSKPSNVPVETEAQYQERWARNLKSAAAAKAQFEASKAGVRLVSPILSKGQRHLKRADKQRDWALKQAAAKGESPVSSTSPSAPEPPSNEEDSVLAPVMAASG